jgi:NADH:ubiquinone oxidoreductase subunit C
MISKEEKIKANLEKNKIAGKPLEITIKRHNRIFINVLRNDLKKVVQLIAKEPDLQHLSTITARDTGTDFEILYHFFVDGILLTIRTTCPRNDPTVDSIVGIFPGAILYEREINDILGIIPKNHPDLRRLILPDNWVGGFPLRKDWKSEGGDANAKS